MTDVKTVQLKDQVTVRLDEAAHSTIIEAHIGDANLYQIIHDVPEVDRPAFVARALRVGALALRDAHTVAKADYVEKEFSRMRSEFERTMDRMFGPQGQVSIKLASVFGGTNGEKGDLERKLETFFGKDGRFEKLMDKFLGEEGDLQRTIEDAVGDEGKLKSVLDEFLGENGELRRALDREFGERGGRLYTILDPSNEKTPLGRLRKQIEERFDPQREGSVIYELRQDLRGQIEKLRTDLGVKEATDAERTKGTQKGAPFEDLVLGAVEAIAAPFGDRVEGIGRVQGYTGDKGDVLSTLDRDSVGGLERRIIIEAKNKALTLKGKSAIYAELDGALENRAAHFAIAAVHKDHADGFAPLRFTSPDKILVAVDPDEESHLALDVAYKLARALVASRALQREATFDAETLGGHLAAINAQLEKIGAMKTALTSATASIEKVRDMLDDLRDEVRDAVSDIQNAIKATEAGT